VQPSQWLTDRVVRFLTRPVATYDLRVGNDFDRLRAQIRKGDVLLVEGDERVSAVIKYLTQSSWSHAALYVGDELARRGGPLADYANEQFGDDARHVLVEAILEGGVVASPIAKYAHLNVRLCRPHRLRKQDLRTVLDDAVASIGWPYDRRNVVDLALHLLRVSLLPQSRRLEAFALGSGASSRVICTSLLGRLFHRVDYPVLPRVVGCDEAALLERRWRWWPRRRVASSPYAGVFHRRHPTLLTPRDFDLSPFFEIVKFNVIEPGRFDYRRIDWADAASPPDDSP